MMDQSPSAAASDYAALAQTLAGLLTPEEYQALLEAGPQQQHLAGAIAALRQQQTRFEANPVLGAMPWLKRLVYRLTHSTFAQQYQINRATLDLLEALQHDLHTYKVSQTRVLSQLARRIGEALPPPPPLSRERRFLAEAEHEPDSLPVVHASPASMTISERLLLYSFIYGLKPRACLEIGTLEGGSALIIGAAMDDNNYGQIVCVDPNPRISDETWQQIEHRATLLQGYSPGILAEAQAVAAAPFDFALIDGDHTYAGVIRDIEGTMPVLAPQAYMIFHDSHYFEVKDAINYCLGKYPRQLIDCGEMSLVETPQTDAGGTINGRQVIWGGLRLLRFVRR